MFKIKTFIINLKERTDRLENILNEFKDRDEFDLTVIPAIRADVGAIGLWKTIRYIVKEHAINEPYILICEDDHIFTPAYNANKFQTYINNMEKKKADIILGGISWFHGAIPIDEDLFWIHYFNGTQFYVVFRKFYDRILKTKYYKNEVADLKISSLSINKFCIHPFISIQKDFGYSDATGIKEVINNFEKIFEGSGERLKKIRIVDDYYKYQNI